MLRQVNRSNSQITASKRSKIQLSSKLANTIHTYNVNNVKIYSSALDLRFLLLFFKKSLAMKLFGSRLYRTAMLLAGLACFFEPSRALSAVSPAAEQLHATTQSLDLKLLGQKSEFINPVDAEHRLFVLDIQNSIVYSFVILLTSLGAAAIGFRLQRTAALTSLTDDHRSASRSALGLATVLTAIVIGIVSDDAISTFNQANDNIQGLAVDSLYLDKVLDSYGPEAASIRKQLRDDLRYRITKIQSRESYSEADYQAVGDLPRIEILFRDIADLKPKTSVQEELQSRAMATIGGSQNFGVRGNMAQKRWLFTVGDANAPRPIYLLVVLSLGLEFLCFGLLTKPHRFTYLSTALAAVVVATTMLVVVELDNPMDGFFTVWVEPLQKAELLMNQ